MSGRDEHRPYVPQEQRQVPFWVRYDTKPLWSDIKAYVGVGATGAAMVMALYDAHAVGAPLSYSRSSDWYAPSRYRHPLLTLGKVRSAADILDREGWVRHYKADPGSRGWQSALEAKPELIALVDRLLEGKPKLRIMPLPEPIILRDQNGRPADYRDTRDTHRKRGKVEAFNEAIQAARVLSPDGQDLAYPMARIFNIDMKRGGRFYGMGPSWQNITAGARKAITINNEPVVELDYKTLHPAILYAQAGVPMPADCYDIGGWPRPLVKVAMLTLINARTVHSARLSIAHSEHMSDLTVLGSQEALALASKIIGAIKARHRPIAAAFHSDAGAALMRIDSDMAEAVMTLLMLRKGIVTLPVHDSFLVPASKRDELETAMMQAAYDVARLPDVRVTEAK